MEPIEITYEITFTKKDGRTHSFFRSGTYRVDAIRAARNAFQWRFGYLPISTTSVEIIND